MDLRNKHVIVVGGSSGMGLGIARMALDARAKVTIVGRSEDKLEDVKSNLAGNGKLNTIAADITSESDVITFFDTIESFDYLVNTAADITGAYQPIAELNVEAARTVMDSKLTAAILLAKHGGRKVNSDGAFVFTSGIAAYRPSFKGSVIAAVNGSLEALVRALALELAPVRVNAISPGWVDTPIWDKVAGDEKEEILKQKAKELPAHKIGEPEDIAQAVLSLMQNSYITGTTLHVDGGQRLV